MSCGGTQLKVTISQQQSLPGCNLLVVGGMDGEWWCASEYEPSHCVLSATTANNSSVCNLWNYRESNLPTRRRGRKTTDPPTIDRWTSFKSDHYNLCAPCEWTHPTPSLYISARCAGVETLQWFSSFDCCDNCNSDASVQKLIPWMWSDNSYLISADYV